MRRPDMRPFVVWPYKPATATTRIAAALDAANLMSATKSPMDLHHTVTFAASASIMVIYLTTWVFCTESSVF